MREVPSDQRNDVPIANEGVERRKFAQSQAESIVHNCRALRIGGNLRGGYHFRGLVAKERSFRPFTQDAERAERAESAGSGRQV